MSICYYDEKDEKDLTHGLKNLKMGGKNGRRLTLNEGCNLKKLIPLSKSYFHLKSSCLRKLWNLNNPSSFVMESKILPLYNQEFKRPKCGLLKK